MQVMIFAILHRRSHFDQMTVRVIEAYDLLSPAVRLESVDILHFRVIPFQLFDKPFDVGFFKVELAGIVFRDDFFSEKRFPVFLFLQYQTVRQYHVPAMIKDHLETEQIMVELSGSFDIIYNDQEILKSHIFSFLHYRL